MDSKDERHMRVKRMQRFSVQCFFHKLPYGTFRSHSIHITNRIMRTLLPRIAVLMAIPIFAQSQVQFDRFFHDRTMRIDVFHSGTKQNESFALDRVYREGGWPGSTVNLLDTLNLGEYMARVFDSKTGLLIYSRGYSAVFNEWQTTDEANQGAMKTISESVRIPFPRRSITFSILRRDKFQIYRDQFSITIDPNDPTRVCTETRNAPGEIVPLMMHGDPHKKVDILILGDGYTSADVDKFKEDAKHFNDVMFSTSPFKERKNDFNVRALCVPSEQSGIDIPDRNEWKTTAFGTMYNTFGSARYVLTEANRELRNAASAAPYDFITILINDSRYGGGGIYQLYTTTYTIEKTKGQEWQRDYVYVHEFGHAFAGLGDEYYSSSTGYNDFYPEGIEPWEPNVTRLLHAPAVKWQEFVNSGMSVPTDWGKHAYDSLGALLGKLDRLAEDYYTKREPIRTSQQGILKNSALLGKVGAFEGAGYVSSGMYRPSLDCRMFSLSLVDFDPVCNAAIQRQIDFYSR